MDIRRLVSSSAFGIALVASIVACSGADNSGSTIGGSSPSKDTSPTTPSKNNASSSSGSTGSSSGGSSSGAPSPDGGPTSNPTTGNDAACAAKTTAQDCGECCYQNHQAGADAADQAWGDCICGAGGACATECAATVCSQNGGMPKQGDACDTCLQGATAQACETKADTACKANAECVAFDACLASAKCDDKK